MAWKIIFVILFFFHGPIFISFAVATEVNTSVGIENGQSMQLDNDWSQVFEGSKIPREIPSTPGFIFSPSQPPAVNLGRDNAWNEGSPAFVFSIKDTWTLAELNEALSLWDERNKREKEVKVYKSFSFWSLRSQTASVKFIAPVAEKEKENKSQEKQYELLGKIDIQAPVDPFILCLLIGRAVLEKGADGVIVDAIGSEKIQWSELTSKGFSPFGSFIVNNAIGGGSVIGWAKHRGTIGYTSNAYVRARAVKLIKVQVPVIAQPTAPQGGASLAPKEREPLSPVPIPPKPKSKSAPSPKPSYIRPPRMAQKTPSYEKILVSPYAVQFPEYEWTLHEKGDANIKYIWRIPKSEMADLSRAAEWLANRWKKTENRGIEFIWVGFSGSSSGDLASLLGRERAEHVKLTADQMLLAYHSFDKSRTDKIRFISGDKIWRNRFLQAGIKDLERRVFLVACLPS